MDNVTVAVMPKPHAPVEIRQIPEPDLEPNSALLDVTLSEVCGTDVHLRDGRLHGVPYPIIPGHVSVGRLAKIRGQLLDIEGKPFNEGDPVTFLDVHKTCYACYHCLVAKATTRCPKRKVYGITYGLKDGLTGGWATKLYLKPGTHILRLHDVDFQRFMAGGCSLPTALHAVDRADVMIGHTVLILGSGPVGLSAVIFALMAGAIRVLCIGAPQHRLQTARDIGAHDTLNIEHHDDQQRLRWILNQTKGHGADVTIEAMVSRPLRSKGWGMGRPRRRVRIPYPSPKVKNGAPTSQRESPPATNNGHTLRFDRGAEFIADARDQRL